MFSPLQFANLQKWGKIKVKKVITQRSSDGKVWQRCVISVNLKDDKNVVALGCIPTEWLGPHGKPVA